MRKQVTDRRKAMGIALIQKPLRFIKNRAGEFSPDYKLARAIALSGNGVAVQRIARSML